MRNIPAELRKGIDSPNLAEKLAIAAEVVSTASDAVDVTGAAARSAAAGMGAVQPALLATAFFVQAASNPVASLGMGAKVAALTTAQVGALLRGRDSKTISDTTGEFSLHKEVRTKMGKWEVFIAKEDTEAAGRFLALYTRDDVAKTLFAGESLDDESIEGLIQQLTKKTLEPGFNPIHWPMGPPDSDNGVKYGVVQGSKAVLVALLADLGLVGVTPKLIEAFHSFLDEKNISALTAYPVLLIPLLLTFLGTSAKLGSSLGLRRDEKITKQLPESAGDYHYGRSALNVFRNSAMRDIFGSVTGSVRSVCSRLFSTKSTTKES